MEKDEDENAGKGKGKDLNSLQYALSVSTIDELCEELAKRYDAFVFFATQDRTAVKTSVTIRHRGGLSAIGLVEVAVPFLHAAFHEEIDGGEDDGPL